MYLNEFQKYSARPLIRPTLRDGTPELITEVDFRKGCNAIIHGLFYEGVALQKRRPRWRGCMAINKKIII